MPTDLDRRIPLAGLYNFRDLGGYRAADGRTVRWRRLFRSDGHHRLAPDDIAALRNLGIATVIDLRTMEELAETGRSPLHDGQATHHRHVPFLPTFNGLPTPERPGLAGFYLRDIALGCSCVVEVFRLLTEEPSYPAVYHCAGGKDRTGVISALILRALGVDDEQIIADYALTDHFMARWAEEVQARGEPAPPDLRDPNYRHATPEVMAEFLAAFDERYGSVQRFFADVGIEPARVERLRELLLTDED
jgi:protein-tyrosine phosphatase